MRLQWVGSQIGRIFLRLYYVKLRPIMGVEILNYRYLMGIPMIKINKCVRSWNLAIFSHLPILILMVFIFSTFLYVVHYNIIFLFIFHKLLFNSCLLIVPFVCLNYKIFSICEGNTSITGGNMVPLWDTFVILRTIVAQLRYLRSNCDTLDDIICTHNYDAFVTQPAHLSDISVWHKSVTYESHKII